MTQPPDSADSNDADGSGMKVENRKLLAIMNLATVIGQCDAELRGWNTPNGDDSHSLPQTLTESWQSPAADDSREDLDATVTAIDTCMDTLVAVVDKELTYQRDEVGTTVPPNSEEANWGIVAKVSHPL